MQQILRTQLCRRNGTAITAIKGVGAHRIELWTSFLSGKRSTTELRAQLFNC